MCAKHFCQGQGNLTCEFMVYIYIYITAHIEGNISMNIFSKRSYIIRYEYMGYNISNITFTHKNGSSAPVTT
jgi:hypothetical protein